MSMSHIRITDGKEYPDNLIDEEFLSKIFEVDIEIINRIKDDWELKSDCHIGTVSIYEIMYECKRYFMRKDVIIKSWMENKYSSFAQCEDIIEESSLEPKSVILLSRRLLKEKK